MKTIIKIALLAIFIGCLSRMPYSYYQFARIASLIGFGVLAYKEYEDKHYVQLVICVAAAILMNPIAPLHFKRPVWQDIDKAIAVLLILWIIIDVVVYVFLKYGKSKK